MIFRIVLFFILLNVSALDAKSQEDNLSQPIPGRFIVEFKDSGDSASVLLDNLEAKHGVQKLHAFNHVFKGGNLVIPPGKEKELREDPSVKSLVQDFTVWAFENEGLVGQSHTMGGGGTTGQVIPTGINWIDAELNTTNEGSGATVAVLDTGIDFDHPDLMVNIPLSRDFTTDGTGGDDNNNSIKGHGTHVAGVIAALNNNIGVLGVGSQIDLVALKVLDRTGSGTFGWIIAGLDYVSANSAVIGIINLSLGARGGTNPSQAFKDASALLQAAVQRATNAGVIVVVAAGNDAVNVTSNNVVPAMYPEVFTVSALDDRNGQVGSDKWASFSNYGLEVDIIAPGVLILSTSNDGKTSSLSGTSFSSPHVAGTVGLYIVRNGRPLNGDARLLSSLLSSISKIRSSLLSGEPNDGRIEPSCYANGAGLQ